jgi:hypothetical protein
MTLFLPGRRPAQLGSRSDSNGSNTFLGSETFLSSEPFCSAQPPKLR